jgi:hypothetical protein
MSNLVSEKQAGLRLALRNMGMLESAYWASWMAFDAVITLLTALLLVLFGECACLCAFAHHASTAYRDTCSLTCIRRSVTIYSKYMLLLPPMHGCATLSTSAGMALQFNYFLRNDFGLLLMLFWLFGLAMTSYSYVLSVLVKKAQAAVYLGFSVFIVGWVFQTVIFVARLPYRADTYYSETNIWGRVFFWVFALFPWNPLTKGIMDFNEATLAATDPGTGVRIKG